MALTAFILAGGQSSRMGGEKALLEFGGRTLLEHALEKARAVAEAVYVVGAREKFNSFGPVLEDAYPRCGPLAGIHAALRSTQSELNLVLAVDTPFVEERFLRYLVEKSQESAALVTVPQTQDGWHPLCAVYRREFAEAAEAALRARHFKIDALFSPGQTRTISAAELEKFAFDPAMFQNLNTPQELAAARRRLRERST